MDETQKTGPTPFNDPVDVVPGTTSLADGWGWLADFRDAESAEEAQRRVAAHPALIAERDRLREALKECRGALQYFIDSEVIERSSVVNAWAAAVAAESKARAALGEGK